MKPRPTRSAPRLPSHPLPIDQTQSGARLLAHEEILGDGQIRDEREFLEDRHDANGDRVGWAAEGDRLAVVGDRARVRGMNPAQDLHHRALAGAVLAEEGVNFSRLTGELRAVQRDDAAETLVDASGAKEGHAVRNPLADEQVIHLSC